MVIKLVLSTLGLVLVPLFYDKTVSVFVPEKMDNVRLILCV